METLTAYIPLPPGRAPEKRLVLQVRDGERAFPFHDHVEIGRLKPGAAAVPGVLLIDDPTISSRHCVVTQATDGRCTVRDTSRNGTRIDNRRLVPGVESEFRVGQILSVGSGRDFRLEGEAARAQAPRAAPSTMLAPTNAEVTVVVGDIRGYTTLVRSAPGEALQESVSRLFGSLQAAVADLGGTVKEYPGDALFAYWEGCEGESCAVRACRAAIALERRGRELAADAAVWKLREHPLGLDWALATGPVIIHSLGEEHRLGLSMIGEPVVRAFRLEKLADEATGPIITCRTTRTLAADAFRFRELGEQKLDGFDRPEPTFALIGAP